MDSIAAHSDGYSPRCSCTILTARSRTSGENLFDLLMAQSSQSVEPPQNPGRFTFPSPVTDDRAVSFHLVKGRYEKGGARINQPEAQALVADLVGRLKQPGFRESGLTIGVVTFNSEQQGLIEDLLDAERRKDPSLEPHFSEMELEPLFVKNLESVQGDERDIMYFSITYGPDPGGAVSMNFGPLNRDGGERRLNVAVTRARHELRVFSSLRGEQMDLSRTKAIGVRDLKHFLEFAEYGTRALAEAHRGSLGDFDSPFESSVATALGRKGWQVHTQIGASSFRIDLGVVHPDFPGRYLAGVECDGATYHRSATARDRDKLREQVLRGLGWEIVRIWSTDWWVNPGGTLDRVNHALNELLEKDRVRRAEEERAQAASEKAVPGEEDSDTASKDFSGVDPASSLVDTVNQADESAEILAVSSSGEGVYAREESPLSNELHVKVMPLLDNRWKASNPIEAVSADAISVDNFYEHTYDSILHAMVDWVVSHEGPVQGAVLARRIARAHEFQRTGSRIQARIDNIARQIFKSTEESGGVFYWPREVDPCDEIPFRRPSDDETNRDVDEICEAELLSLARQILLRNLPEQDALVAMARELGMQRLREASRSRLERVLQLKQRAA